MVYVQTEESSTTSEHISLGSNLLEDGSDTFLSAGISLQSVENTIAKAQATEQFRSHIIPSLGLDGDLSSLAKYAEDICEGDNTKTTDGKDSTELDLAEIDDNEIEAVSNISIPITFCVFSILKYTEDVAGS